MSTANYVIFIVSLVPRNGIQNVTSINLGTGNEPTNQQLCQQHLKARARKARDNTGEKKHE